MIETPKLSIILPVYNVEKYVAKCIESILDQTFTEFELIIVNDGSTDGSKDICEQYAAKDSRITLINQQNKGLGGARNTGIRIAKSEIIAFVDSDDYILTDMYDYLMDLFERTGVDIAMCNNFKNIEEFVQPKLVEKEFDYSDFMPLILCDQINSNAFDKIYKKQLFAKISFPEGRYYGEDVAIMHKVFGNAKKIVVSSKKLYIYNVTNASSITNDRSKVVLNAVHRGRSFVSRYEYALSKKIDCAAYLLAQAARFYLSASIRINKKDSANAEIKKFFERYTNQILLMKGIPLKIKILTILKRLNCKPAFFILANVKKEKTNQNRTYEKTNVSKLLNTD